MKNKIKKIIIFFITKINKFLYPSYDVKNSVHHQLIILKFGFFQKILGFNRHVPWPVHYSSTVTVCKKIIPGTRTPGLGKNCHIDGRNGIVFGKNVWIGPGVKVISMNHDVNNYENYIEAKSIKVGDNCWLGVNSIILPEVELGNHTIVAAGAVVTKSFLDGDQILGGNPAKIIKKLKQYEEHE